MGADDDDLVGELAAADFGDDVGDGDVLPDAVGEGEVEGNVVGVVIEEATEAMLMIEPAPRSIIPGRNARIMRYIARTLISIEKANLSSSVSRMVPCST